MAHPADVLTRGEARCHWRVMSRITEIERSLGRHTTVGNLCSKQRVEAQDLHQQLARIFDKEVKTQLGAREGFARIGEDRLPSEHGAGGVQTTPDPTGGGIISRRDEVITNTATGLTIDTAGRRGTLTQHREDTGEPEESLRPTDMSRLVATPAERSNPDVKPVVHPGEAGTVIERQKREYKTQAGSHVPVTVDT